MSAGRQTLELDEFVCGGSALIGFQQGFHHEVFGVAFEPGDKADFLHRPCFEEAVVVIPPIHGHDCFQAADQSLGDGHNRPPPLGDMGKHRQTAIVSATGAASPRFGAPGNEPVEHARAQLDHRGVTIRSLLT